MSSMGMFFPLERQAELRVGHQALRVNFEGAGEDRTIVVEPRLRAVLTRVVTERAGETIPWSELRSLLEDRGIDVAAADSRRPG